MLTDGEPNGEADVFYATPGYTTLANRIKTCSNGKKNATIHTIGFNVTSDAATILTGIASPGKYHSASNTNIQQVFADIANDIGPSEEVTVSGLANISNSIVTTRPIKIEVTPNNSTTTTTVFEGSLRDAINQGYITEDEEATIRYHVDAATNFTAGDHIKITYNAEVSSGNHGLQCAVSNTGYKATEIVINGCPTDRILGRNESVNLTVSYAGSTATFNGVTWTSKNKNNNNNTIADVESESTVTSGGSMSYNSGDGTVTKHRPYGVGWGDYGVAVITATLPNGLTATCEIEYQKNGSTRSTDNSTAGTRSLNLESLELPTNEETDFDLEQAVPGAKTNKKVKFENSENTNEELNTEIIDEVNDVLNTDFSSENLEEVNTTDTEEEIKLDDENNEEPVVTEEVTDEVASSGPTSPEVVSENTPLVEDNAIAENSIVVEDSINVEK
jgi:hypothetical protein